MKKRKTLPEIIFDVFNITILGLISLICIYPMLYVLFASVSDPVAIGTHTGILIMPLGFSLESYKAVFSNKYIGIGYLNTICYLFFGTLTSIFLTSLGAYGLSVRTVAFSKAILFFILFTMFFGGGLIPTYLLVKELKLVDSRLAMIIPSAISAWNLIVMRTAFISIPESLTESAKIDGANDFYILFKIVIPLSKAVVAVMLLFYGVGYWNNWFDAMVYLRNRNLYPLQLILREILITNQMERMIAEMDDEIDKFLIAESLKYTTIIIATVPVLLIYPFLQKYFVKGVMIGAIKG